jgi:hypothetical protein
MHNMKVFISWSGELSKQVAQLLGAWIEDVLQGTKRWISTDDIDKGAIWFGEITTELANTGVGIICLTRENLQAPWILFEAGALSKGLTKSRVCPFLVDLGVSEISPPLSQLNATMPNKEDVTKLIKTINSARGESALAEEKVEKSVGMWWPRFDEAFQKALKEYRPKEQVKPRKLDDKIDELLQITRALQRQTTQSQKQPVEEVSRDIVLRWLSGDKMPLNLHETLKLQNWVAHQERQFGGNDKRYLEAYMKFLMGLDEKGKRDEASANDPEAPEKG